MVGKKLTLILNPELAQILETLKNTEAFREKVRRKCCGR